MSAVLAIDLGGTRLRAGIADAADPAAVEAVGEWPAPEDLEGFREHVRELLRSLAATKTILLSTHILREVKAVAERVLFIHQGRLVHDGPVPTLGDTAEAMERRFHELTAA